MSRATKLKLSLIDFQRRFEEEFDRQLPNPQDSTPEEIRATATKIGTSLGVRRLQVNVKLECEFENGKRKCKLVIEIIRP
ncbi:MAG TPA: hypothetical protein VKA95_11310 [Nitrososphaeraceae archaeon]|nr:hypothetical protein [Nitrososphaeraceae archaeon]